MNRWCFLYSGGGSTLEAVLNAILDGELTDKAEIGCLITNNPRAGGTMKALSLDVTGADILYTERHMHESRDEWADVMGDFVFRHNCTHFAQLGWLPRTPDRFIKLFNEGANGFNQHPGPLDPGFSDFGGDGMYGMAVHAARMLYVKTILEDWWTEATTHLVVSQLDKGAVIGRVTVPFGSRYTVEELQAQVLPVEHQLVIDTIKAFAEGSPRRLIRSGRLIPVRHADTLELAKNMATFLYSRRPKGDPVS